VVFDLTSLLGFVRLSIAHAQDENVVASKTASSVTVMKKAAIVEGSCDFGLNLLLCNGELS